MSTRAKVEKAVHYPTKRDLAFRKWARDCPQAEWVSCNVIDVGDDDVTYSVHFNLKLEKEVVA